MCLVYSPLSGKLLSTKPAAQQGVTTSLGSLKKKPTPSLRLSAPSAPSTLAPFPRIQDLPHFCILNHINHFNHIEMRKLKLQMQMSVDGFVAGPEGQLDWMTWTWDVRLQDFVRELTDSVDTIVMGRKMADGFMRHW